LKVPLAVIIGDNEGGDRLAGRRVFYGLDAKRISRTCDAKPENYHDFTVGNCEFLVMQDVIDYIDNHEWDKLQDLYQNPAWNPFFDLDYGGSTGGIFTAACPPEALHALENGIMLHALK